MGLVSLLAQTELNLNNVFSPVSLWGFSFSIAHLCGLLSFLLYKVNWTEPWLKTEQKINQFLFAVKQKYCGQLLRYIHTIRGTPKDSSRDLLCNVVTDLLQNLFHWVFTVISTWLSNLVTFKQTWDNSGILFIAVMSVTSKKNLECFLCLCFAPPHRPLPIPVELISDQPLVWMQTRGLNATLVDLGGLHRGKIGVRLIIHWQ